MTSPPFPIPSRHTWHHHLPPPIRTLLEQVQEAVKHRLNILSVAGLRMLVEAAGKTEAPEASSLRGYLEAFLRRGLIGRRLQVWLLAVVEHGNKAIHESVAVQDEDLDALLLSVEHLLQELYGLQAAVPPCPRRSTIS
ncbi:DUF4145 domain-containing protein [Corallococcus sp. CA054B]|uniref:DUF4145 domain-containing protein n=1 Tax=Corallococcus sp. CA054B TaxID=2316734 RepID=UPI000EA16ED9|nr:DUF4145 domain-containing protein [Corallococcus sp. CA054B]RKG68311.1 DUF4145 domain-containing protein [Corallococcus sp. CA054B]